MSEQIKKQIEVEALRRFPNNSTKFIPDEFIRERKNFIEGAEWYHNNIKESENIEMKKARDLMKSAQDDMLRMMENAKIQKTAEMLVENKYATGFHGGNVMAFEYACKHLTNILERTE